MDIEEILYTFEDDYNPSSMVPGPRNMNQGGRIPFDNGGDVEAIAKQTEPLGKKKQLILFKSYDNIYKQEYKRLFDLGDPFSKSDLSRAIINRIASENPTINLTKGIGLDKIPGGGNERSKTIFENIDKKFNKKELSKFTQGNQTNARINTKNQESLFKEILKGNNDLSSLAKKFKIPEERLGYRVEKLMRNLAKSSGDQYTFLTDFKEKDLEKVRNNIYNSPTLENVYQRTLTQSILQSTELGSPERKQAFDKLQEFNKFKRVMLDNGLDPKLLAMDHAASYRAIKNGNVKNFLAVTPVMSDINTLKSSFDKRSQLNLRRMQEYLKNGDAKNYKYFLKNQTELENLWKTMTGGQSSLGKIRVRATGPEKGTIKITDYGSTSLLDKNKNLLDELANNLDIRKNIVNASSIKNLDEARRIMLEGSELTEKKMLGTMKKTDRAAKTIIDQSFKDINKPEMFKTENQIRTLLADLGCPKSLQKASGGRIKYSTGSSCPGKGEKKLNKLLFEGGGTTTERNLVQKIISGGGKMALSMLNPKELIRLKNLVGPGALGLMGAYEVGSITDDVLRLNKPLDEALAGNWLTKSFLPYSEEFAKQKNLLQSGQLTGDQKEYALEMMKMENFIKEGKRIEGLEANKLVEGTLDDDFTFTSDKDMNKAYSDLFGRFSRLKPYAYEQGITGRSLENEAAMNEYIDAQTARTGASKIFGGPQPMVNKAPRSKNMTRGPMTEKGKMNLDFSIPGYTPYDKTYTPTDEEILQIYRNQGIVPATFGGELQPGEGTRIRMGLASQGGNRSIYGSKFMEGGIASLNVNKK